MNKINCFAAFGIVIQGVSFGGHKHKKYYILHISQFLPNYIAIIVK